MKFLPILGALLPLFAVQASLAGDSVPLHLQEAVMVGHDDTIDIHNVPVAGPDGKSYDLELHLAIKADGSVVLGNSKAVPAQPLPESPDQFLPGDYVCTSGARVRFTVTGPVATAGGRRLWTFIGAMNDAEGYYSGTWITGPAAGHPQLVGADPHAVFPKDQSIGRLTNGDLILVQQLGDKLIIGTARVQQNPNTHVTEVALNDYYILKRKPVTPN